MDVDGREGWAAGATLVLLTSFVGPLGGYMVLAQEAQDQRAVEPAVQEAEAQRAAFLETVVELAPDQSFLNGLPQDEISLRVALSGAVLIEAIKIWNPAVDVDQAASDLQSQLEAGGVGPALIEPSLALLDSAFIADHPEFAAVAIETIDLVNPALGEHLTTSLELADLDIQSQTLTALSDGTPLDGLDAQFGADVHEIFVQTGFAVREAPLASGTAAQLDVEPVPGSEAAPVPGNLADANGAPQQPDVPPV